MNEEEKKAIEYFKALNKVTFEPYLSILLNLLDKQQKEIDTHIETENYYEHELARKDEEIEELKKENFDTVYIQAIENYKDTIRELIEKHYPDIAITKLNELLEE